MRAEKCPGIDATGGLLEADGFYLTLEDSLVTVLPGQELHIRGPGFRAAQLTAGWVVDTAGTADHDGTVWTLLAPQQPCRYEIDLGLTWAKGQAAQRHSSR
jgi:hypothetical protein